MSPLRVVVTVSTDRSDLYFANQLIKRLNVVGVIVENQKTPADQTSGIAKALKLLPRPHILLKRTVDFVLQRMRDKYAIYNQPANLADFGDEGFSLFSPPGCNVLRTDGIRDINDSKSIAWLKSMQPDVVAVCGASLLKRDFIATPAKGVLNLHGGLAQYYRGLNTTDWAVHNGEPECVGATVHFVAPGIDDGNIIYQGRPTISADDTPNTLYVKVVKLGIEMMTSAINNIQNGTLKSTPLTSKGRLYLGKDFTDATRGATWKKYKNGVIANYVANKAQRDAKIDSVMINEFRLQTN